MLRFALPIFLSVAAAPALADVTVRFIEGAPKDRFVIENTDTCALQDVVVEIDLSQSKAGLIFDVTGAGAGVDVFQPLEIETGAALLVSVPQVLDGDDKVSLSLRALNPGAGLSFTIDVDDTAGTRATMIADTEIEGAQITVVHAGNTATSAFGRDAVATASLSACQT